MAKSGEMVKKCPFCSATLKTTDTECHACKRKVGPANDQGIAEKPFDWVAYTKLTIAVVLFAGFIWWAFFRQ